MSKTCLIGVSQGCFTLFLLLPQPILTLSVASYPDLLMALWQDTNMALCYLDFLNVLHAFIAPFSPPTSVHPGCRGPSQGVWGWASRIKGISSARSQGWCHDQQAGPGPPTAWGWPGIHFSWEPNGANDTGREVSRVSYIVIDYNVTYSINYESLMWLTFANRILNLSAFQHMYVQYIKRLGSQTAWVTCAYVLAPLHFPLSSVYIDPIGVM